MNKITYRFTESMSKEDVSRILREVGKYIEKNNPVSVKIDSRGEGLYFNAYSSWNVDSIEDAIDSGTIQYLPGVSTKIINFYNRSTGKAESSGVHRIIVTGEYNVEGVIPFAGIVLIKIFDGAFSDVYGSIRLGESPSVITIG